MRRSFGAKHCSLLCSQSEGGEYCGGQARAENPTKSCSRALVMFATCSWPSLCEQSELQCWRRNRRLCGPAQFSAARALPLNFNFPEMPYKQSSSITSGRESMTISGRRGKSGGTNKGKAAFQPSFTPLSIPQSFPSAKKKRRRFSTQSACRRRMAAHIPSLLSGGGLHRLFRPT